jgi:hypothetical protein
MGNAGEERPAETSGVGSDLDPAAAQDHLRASHHADTLTAVLGSSLRITLESNEWFTWLGHPCIVCLRRSAGPLDRETRNQTARRRLLDYLSARNRERAQKTPG